MRSKNQKTRKLLELLILWAPILWAFPLIMVFICENAFSGENQMRDIINKNGGFISQNRDGEFLRQHGMDPKSKEFREFLKKRPKRARHCYHRRNK